MGQAGIEEASEEDAGSRIYVLALRVEDEKVWR